MISAPSAVRQTTVMSCHAECGAGLPLFEAFKSPCGGVIYFCTVIEQPFLKSIRILSDIVGQSDKLPLLLRSKCGGKGAG